MAEASSEPRIAAVVLTWNETELTSRCIASVSGGTRRPERLILVDNGSATDCAGVLAAQFPEIEVLRLDKNYGFTGGCNRGIERALEGGADYVWMLNNDTEAAPDALELLAEALNQHPEAGLVHPLLLHPEPGKRIQFFYGRLERDVAWHCAPDDGQAWSEAYRRTIETPFAPACAPLYRAAALRQVGLFDERLYITWEDYDLHMRIRDAGWKIYTVGAAEMVHRHGHSTGRTSPFVTYFMTRNRFICLLRYARPLGFLRRFLFFLRTWWWQIKAQGFDNWEAHRAALQGIRDFLLGVRGRANPPTRTRD
jgi:GT2 family glycosyltransferase